MTSKIATFSIAAYATLMRAGDAFGHDGHGFAGTHWHATDTWGFAAAGLAVAVALWLGGRGK